jgi:hypothetical protein
MALPGNDLEGRRLTNLRKPDQHEISYQKYKEKRGKNKINIQYTFQAVSMNEPGSPGSNFSDPGPNKIIQLQINTEDPVHSPKSGPARLENMVYLK